MIGEVFGNCFVVGGGCEGGLWVCIARMGTKRPGVSCHCTQMMKMKRKVLSLVSGTDLEEKLSYPIVTPSRLHKNDIKQ